MDTQDRMTGEDFQAWADHMEFNDSQVARTLDLSRNTVVKYKREGAPAYIGFACAAIAFGLPMWRRAA